MKKTIQAKHVDTLSVLRCVKRFETRKDAPRASRWEIHADFPGAPPKVVNAKLRALVLRGLLAGCSLTHNCRGDFTVAPAGDEALRSTL